MSKNRRFSYSFRGYAHGPLLGGRGITANTLRCSHFLAGLYNFLISVLLLIIAPSLSQKLIIAPLYWWGVRYLQVVPTVCDTFFGRYHTLHALSGQHNFTSAAMGKLKPHTTCHSGFLVILNHKK